MMGLLGLSRCEVLVIGIALAGLQVVLIQEGVLCLVEWKLLEGLVVFVGESR